MQKREGGQAQRLRDLTSEASELDARHDRKARGLFHLLSGAIEVVDKLKTRDQYAALQSKLFPHGVQVVRFSYTDQAGEVELLERRTTSADRKLLRKLKLDKTTGEDALEAWIKAGRALGAVCNQRIQLATRADDSAIKAGDIHLARLQWIRVVNALLVNLPLSGSPEEERQRLLANLVAAEKSAAPVPTPAPIAEAPEAAPEDEATPEAAPAPEVTPKTE